jgi:hypothetical protein
MAEANRLKIRCATFIRGDQFKVVDFRSDVDSYCISLNTYDTSAEKRAEVAQLLQGNYVLFEITDANGEIVVMEEFAARAESIRAMLKNRLDDDSATILRS